MTSLAMMHESPRYLPIVRSAAVQSRVGPDQARRTARAIPRSGDGCLLGEKALRGQNPGRDKPLFGDKRERLRK
jgi:hypothetical protein